MNEKDLEDASSALIDWLNSQAIEKNDSLTIMMRLIAYILVTKSNTDEEIQNRINHFFIDFANECHMQWIGKQKQ